jgi:hypothetical protein
MNEAMKRRNRLVSMLDQHWGLMVDVGMKMKRESMASLIELITEPDEEIFYQMCCESQEVTKFVHKLAMLGMSDLIVRLSDRGYFDEDEESEES